MLLRAEYVALAMRMQEMADAKVDTSEAGARNSRSDLKQLQAIHDAATSLGATCSMMEAAKPKEPENVSRETESMKLVESASTLETIVLKEARADYEIKLIAPGKGSSAFYPAEVLKRDGPNVFKANTHIYLNHATRAEEAERPEGDVKNLAGVLTTDATYNESHAKGPGLYARMKVFADHGQLVEEKAPHVGMSIRANGDAVMEGKRPVMRDGVPVLARLTSAESVDVVTKAGAGGMILTEAARTANSQQESAMTEEQITKLVESAVAAAVKSVSAPMAGLTERALRGDAMVQAQKILAGVSLAEASKARVIDMVLERTIPVKEGALDVAAFTEAVNFEAKREGEYISRITGGGRVTGMGSAPVDPVKLQEARTREKAEAVEVREAGESVFGRLMGGNKEAAKAAASKGVAA